MSAFTTRLGSSSLSSTEVPKRCRKEIDNLMAGGVEDATTTRTLRYFEFLRKSDLNSPITQPQPVCYNTFPKVHDFTKTQ